MSQLANQGPLALARSLRGLRRGAGLSLSELGRRSGIAKATLSRWESGDSEPTLGALDPVLRSLRTSPEHRQEVLALIKAPRGFRAVRGYEAESQQEWSEVGLGTLPTGSLLRAMRIRRGLRIEQIAAQLQIAPATLSRWELGERLPDLESIDRLCNLLGALPEERTWVTSRRISIPPLRTNLDGLLEQYRELAVRGRSLRLEGMELRLHLLEGAAWNLSKSEPRGLDVLGATLAFRSQHLLELGRFAEGRRVAKQALAIPEGDLQGHFCGMPPAALLAWSTFSLCPDRKPLRQLDLLHGEIRCTRHPEFKAEFLTQTLRYLAASGMVELLPSRAEEAKRAWLEAGRSEADEVVSWFLGEAYLAAGCPERALETLPVTRHTRNLHKLHLSIAWAEAYARLGDMNAAQPHLETARSILPLGPFANFDEQRVLKLFENGAGA